MASASGYNYHRFARAVLKKARKWEPSLSIQLYPTYWRFENSEINFLYDGPMKPFLLAMRAQVIPAALMPFLYDIRPPVSFVDGCLVVELQDFRKVPEVRSRVVMRPAPETLPLTIDIMLERRQETWDDSMTLELESRIMAATSAPLYLGTSIMATRNAALSLALTAPAGPNMAVDGTFRSTHVAGEEEDSELESIRKLLAAGTRSGGTSGAFQPNWSVLRLLERIKQHNKQKELDAAARAAGQTREQAGPAGPGGPPPPSGGVGAAVAGVGGPPPPPAPDEKKKSKKKRPAPPPEKDEEPPKAAKKKKTDKKKEPAPHVPVKDEKPAVPAKKKKSATAIAAAAAAAAAEKERLEKEQAAAAAAAAKKKGAKKDKDAKPKTEKEDEDAPKKAPPKKKKAAKDKDGDK